MNLSLANTLDATNREIEYAKRHSHVWIRGPMSFFPPPRTPLPPGYPLPALDLNGNAIRQGMQVRIPTIPPSLTHDLPGEDVLRLKAIEGKVMRILEVDAYGMVWFGEEAPWFSLRPCEVIALEEQR